MTGKYKNNNIYLILMLIGFLPVCCDLYSQQEDSFSELPYGENILLVTSFESTPNLLGGELGVYGDGEPDWARKGAPHSWFYESDLIYFKKVNVRSGLKSFLLVNGQKGIKNRWASFAIDLGPTLDKKSVPKKVKSFDASGYNTIVLWVKGGKGGEKFNVTVRDARSKSYKPNGIVYNPEGGCKKEWKKIKIAFDDFIGRINWAKLDSIGIEFGANAGNEKSAQIYIDDIYFEKE